MYTFITSLPALPISYTPGRRKLSDIKFIVVHATGNENDTAFANANYFNKWNSRKAGAHLFIDDEYVYQSIAPTRVAYAVGKSFGNINNYNSISIELCSTNGKPTPDTLYNAEIVIKNLMKKYNIPSYRVVRHYDINKKLCPYWKGWSGENSEDWFRFKLRFMG